MNQEEHSIQVKAVTEMRLRFPNLFFYAIPNGGKRHPTVAAKLKAEGVEAGIPDLHIPYAAGVFCGLYIETKTPSGVLSKDQEKVIKRLEAAGNCVKIARSPESAIVNVLNYISLRPDWIEVLGV